MNNGFRLLSWLGLGAGIWLVDCAIHKRNPLTELQSRATTGNETTADVTPSNVTKVTHPKELA